MSSGAYTLKLSRTLYNDTFRAQLLDENQQVIGHLRIVPGVPLDRSLVPEDAPSVPAYLLVIVDDADINKDNLIDFEERASYALLKRFSTEAISFQHCQQCVGDYSIGGACGCGKSANCTDHENADESVL